MTSDDDDEPASQNIFDLLVTPSVAASSLVNASSLRDSGLPGGGRIESAGSDRSRRNESQRRALRETEDRFRRTADQAPVLIWTAGPDTSLDYLEGYCEQLTGRPLEALRENGWLDFVHPDDVDNRLRHADGD